MARTPGVAGGLSVRRGTAGLEATGLQFTAQLNQLQSVDQVSGFNVTQRDRVVAGTLGVQQYPQASFEGATVAIPEGISGGQAVTLTVPGQLTLHGTSRAVTATVQAQMSGNQVQIAGRIPIVMTDFGISPPQLSITRVDSAVSIGFSLVLTRSPA